MKRWLLPCGIGCLVLCFVLALVAALVFAQLTRIIPGKPLPMGQWAFTVGQPEERASIGTGLLEKRAQGVFLIVPLTVSNEGQQAADIARLDLILVDKARNEYATSPEGQGALVIAEGVTFPGFHRMQLGMELTIKVVFDIPKERKEGPWRLRIKEFPGRLVTEIGVP